jgi:hypothetical protein
MLHSRPVSRYGRHPQLCGVRLARLVWGRQHRVVASQPSRPLHAVSSCGYPQPHWSYSMRLTEINHARVDRGALPPRNPSNLVSRPGDRQICSACDRLIFQRSDHRERRGTVSGFMREASGVGEDVPPKSRTPRGAGSRLRFGPHPSTWATEASGCWPRRRVGGAVSAPLPRHALLRSLRKADLAGGAEGDGKARRHLSFALLEAEESGAIELGRAGGSRPRAQRLREQ